MNEDLTGLTFGRLTVLGKSDFITKDGRSTWRCMCNTDGNIINVVGRYLKGGRVKSCGCLKREVLDNATNNFRTHGLSRSSEYSSWSNMKSRCYNPNSTEYHRYGDKSIEVCDEWVNSFETFYADMGPKPSPEHTIDRIENNKGYSKDNCRWATKAEQSINRQHVILYGFNGESLCLAEIARRCGLKDQTLRDRVAKGMSIHEATAKERKMMKADVYWRYNLPIGYYRNTPGDVAEGCEASHLRTSTPSDIISPNDSGLVSYMPRKEMDYADGEAWEGVVDQDREQFFLTASNVHYALAEQFYQLSQGTIQKVPSIDGNYLPEVTIVTADNVAEERERLRNRFLLPD